MNIDVTAVVGPNRRGRRNAWEPVGSCTMTNEEKDLLIAYLIDAGEADPGGGLEEQFMAWFQDRQPDARRGPLQG